VKKGGSPEDVATRPAAYRLPPPEQLPEISRTDETVSVPFVPDALSLPVDGGLVIDVSALLALSSVPWTSTRWFTCFWRSSSFPWSMYASWLPEAEVAPPVVPVALVLPPAVVLLAPPEAPIEASVSTNPPLPLERLALVLPGAPVVPVGDPAVPVVVPPVVVPVAPAPEAPPMPPFHVSALARHPVRVTVCPRPL
jgi:hypothetical protein